MGKLRGFAVVKARNPDRMREIASLGGTRAQASGKGHRFTPELAREAGRKGGARIGENKAHMAVIGRIGAMARLAKTVNPPESAYMTDV